MIISRDKSLFEQLTELTRELLERDLYFSTTSPDIFIHKTAVAHFERILDEASRTQDLGTSDLPLKPGDVVRKCTGDYHLEGIIVAGFKTIKGAERYVVEHQPLAPGLLHIYSLTNLEKLGGKK